MNRLMPKPYLVLVRRGAQYGLLPLLAFSARDARDQARIELNADFRGAALIAARKPLGFRARVVAVQPWKQTSQACLRTTPVLRRYDLLEQLEDKAAQGMDAGQQIERLLRRFDQ